KGARILPMRVRRILTATLVVSTFVFCVHSCSKTVVGLTCWKPWLGLSLRHGREGTHREQKYRSQLYQTALLLATCEDSAEAFRQVRRIEFLVLAQLYAAEGRRERNPDDSCTL